MFVQDVHVQVSLYFGLVGAAGVRAQKSRFFAALQLLVGLQVAVVLIRAVAIFAVVLISQSGLVSSFVHVT